MVLACGESAAGGECVLFERPDAGCMWEDLREGVTCSCEMPRGAGAAAAA